VEQLKRAHERRALTTAYSHPEWTLLLTIQPGMSSRGSRRDFRAGRDPRLEAAFLAGYGSDPRDDEAWHRSRVREAIGTAGWAYQVGDEQFEAQGHRMIADVLSGT
jgi:hypothetical protein